VEEVTEICADKSATATDLSERLLGFVCQHQGAIGLSRLEWTELCRTAWLIAETPALRCYYFGCWDQAGHFLVAPGGRRAARGEHVLEIFGQDKPEPAHLDGGLAPRRHKYSGALCWAGSGAKNEDRRRIEYDSEEYPQGQFLRHVLDSGFTAISWWDRNQGDTRGACNSTILLEGKRDTEEMLEALKTHFPSVLANLDRAGVKLVEVFP
jgi:hypothetical protein